MSKIFLHRPQAIEQPWRSCADKSGENHCSHTATLSQGQYSIGSPAGWCWCWNSMLFYVMGSFGQQFWFFRRFRWLFFFFTNIFSWCCLLEVNFESEYFAVTWCSWSEFGRSCDTQPRQSKMLCLSIFLYEAYKLSRSIMWVSYACPAPRHVKSRVLLKLPLLLVFEASQDHFPIRIL